MRTSIILVLLSAGCAAHASTPQPTTPKPAPEPSVLGEPTNTVPELIVNAMSENADNPYEVEYVQSTQTWSDLKLEKDNKSHSAAIK